ncbi:Peptidase C14, caspase non-catalytic subunit p10 domain-containing protein [Strongyloides ratti]|uniref:Peptidase C14, caspase non-catalytic subunit p10 domain-containing protein n=1 Tax=Strongyloides ratti TaxID=34506 RepID=A0A090KRQ6_STRRB|nr:Peptidase C14, caspase non-catalytic subunit p10 domain-containing protein [Strongyloides ratti]CEF60174.1 Peptidase C14, caspase non-catalytic subunit p10 domain-containing protein [Strongyloides ratti]
MDYLIFTFLIQIAVFKPSRKFKSQTPWYVANRNVAKGNYFVGTLAILLQSFKLTQKRLDILKKKRLNGESNRRKQAYNFNSYSAT